MTAHNHIGGNIVRSSSRHVHARSARWAVGLAAALLATGLPATASAADDVTINLLDVNDFHGRIDTSTVKVAGTIEQLRAAGGEENTLFLSAGDNVGASLFASSSQQDEPTVDVLDALDLAASAVGNHELDGGETDLTGRLEGLADYPHVAANVYRRGTTDPVLPEYELLEASGKTVAFVAATTEETPALVTPAGIADLEFGDPVDAVNRVVAELEASGTPPDVIVAAYHEGAGAGTPEGATLADEIAAGGAFARIATETDPAVDAIFTGHTHKQYVWDAPVPGTDRTRPILQTGSYGENIGQIELTVDGDTDEVVAYEARNVARTTTDDAALVSAYPRVAEVDAIVDDALAQAAVLGGQPVGEVTADITTAYVDGKRDDRASESTLGNLVANALRDSVADTPAGADLGVVNPGGLRNELLRAGSTGADADVNKDGVITYAEANAVLPFVNNLYSVSLTGADLVDVLEQQWQTNPDGSVPSRPYLQLGLSDNVTYTFDADRPAGERITGLYLDGQPVDPARTYKVATFSFLATGGDNFRAFTKGTFVDTGLVDRDAWIAYLREQSPVSPSFARRAIALQGLQESYEAGSTITATLPRLDLTSLGSPANTEVTATLTHDGTTVAEGRFPVTSGAATVSLPVPASAPTGTLSLTLTAAPSGTTLTVPVTITAPPKAEATIRASAYRLGPLGYAVAATVRGSAGPATGTVTISRGDRVVAKARLVHGHALALLLGRFRAGEQLTVAYSGDDSYDPSSTTLTLPRK